MKQTQFTGWRNIETLQAKEIINELVSAKSFQQAKLIIANTGDGKTNTINIFQNSKSNAQHTYVVTVGDSFRLIDIVDELMELLGIPNEFTKHMVHAKLKLIAEKLKQCHKPVLIFDEAENLKPQVLKMLKELYDAVFKYCSIVLIGTEQIMDSILNKRHKNRQSVPQLYRRFKAGIRRITPINKARDFAPFFGAYIPNHKDIQDILLECCENYGELHDYLEPVLRYCSEKNKPLTEDLFRMIHKMPKRSSLKKIA